MAKKLTIEEEQARVAGLWTIENERIEQGYTLVAGVDEAGRGPLAGPVYAAAVILPQNFFIEGINDSKKLSEKKREELYDIIKKNAIAYCVAAVDEKTIDKINILEATYVAMKTAVKGLKKAPNYILTDGNRDPKYDIPHEQVVKGDSKSISIAAASILAKVSRDRYITEMSDKYPEYNFAKHKGYGTKEHTDAILEYGPCEIHRMSFLKKLLEGKGITNREIGAWGEERALEFLKHKGYTLIEKNFNKKWGEIDLIMNDNGVTVFVEVKTRKNASYGNASEYVDAQKIARLRKTCYSFLKTDDAPMRFDVVEVYYHMFDEKTPLSHKINHIENAF